MKVFKNSLSVIKNSFLDLFFPTYCIMCHKSGTELCRNCSTSIKYPDSENMEDIFACFAYQDPIIKKLLHSLKYYNKQTIGNIFGGYIYEKFLEEIAELRTFSEGREILLIPVPLSPKRKKLRGYNQAKLIAKGIIKRDTDNLFLLEDKIISKVKETLPQAKIKNRNSRLKNIVGCFVINNPEKVRGRTIIIVDDVTTTGGTIREIMKVLKKSGCKKVIGFAVAH